MDNYCYTVVRQHAGTGFPMDVQYTTDDRREANTVAKALAGRAGPDVYYSVNDEANPGARPRFFYPGKDGDPSLPLPEVIEVQFHGLTDDGRGAWVTMRYANGWEKWSLWPVENGRVMPG